MASRHLVAIPVYNEEKHLAKVLDETLAYPVDILVVDDGSTDATPAVLQCYPQVRTIRHEPNQGYGGALITAFNYAIANDSDIVITMDSDGQHLPSHLPDFLAACAAGCDIVSGSRYLNEFAIDTPAPKDRRRINRLVTDQLNACFQWNLTDAFCGFKAYRTAALSRLHLTVKGYGMPLELWVEAACKGLRIREIPVPRVYLDPNRSFGEDLDDSNQRLAYYQEVIDQAMSKARSHSDCGLNPVRKPTLILPKT